LKRIILNNKKSINLIEMKKKRISGRKLSEEQRKLIVSLGKEHDSLTGRPVHSLQEIAEKAMALNPGSKIKIYPVSVHRILQLEKIKRKGKKLSGRTMEIIRLGSIHNIQTRRPRYSLQEIGRKTGVSHPHVIKVLNQFKIKRTGRKVIMPK
jgi:hypothetical protein